MDLDGEDCLLLLLFLNQLIYLDWSPVNTTLARAGNISFPAPDSEL